MKIDAWAFRQAMSQFASGVTVVTTIDNDIPMGLTASAFTSLSMDPPLILVCLSKRLETHGAISRAGLFAVNILSAAQRDLGMRFAGLLPEIEDRFAGLAWAKAVTGAPLIEGCLASVDCRVHAIHDGGDHSIFVGQVEAVTEVQPGEPLLYHNRTWGRGLFEV